MPGSRPSDSSRFPCSDRYCRHSASDRPSAWRPSASDRPPPRRRLASIDRRGPCRRRSASGPHPLRHRHSRRQPFRVSAHLQLRHRPARCDSRHRPRRHPGARRTPRARRLPHGRDRPTSRRSAVRRPAERRRRYRARRPRHRWAHPRSSTVRRRRQGSVPPWVTGPRRSGSSRPRDSPARTARSHRQAPCRVSRRARARRPSGHSHGRRVRRSSRSHRRPASRGPQRRCSRLGARHSRCGRRRSADSPDPEVHGRRWRYQPARRSGPSPRPPVSGRPWRHRSVRRRSAVSPDPAVHARRWRHPPARLSVTRRCRLANGRPWRHLLDQPGSEASRRPVPCGPLPAPPRLRRNDGRTHQQLFREPPRPSGRRQRRRDRP